MRTLILVILLLVSVRATNAQDSKDTEDSADTSAAQAAVLAAQRSAETAQAAPVSSGMGTANSCEDAVRFVESPNGLLGEWDLATTRYSINHDETTLLKKYKRDLLSDSWWAASSGPDIARELSTLCKLLNDVLGAMSPTGDPVEAAKDF